ncbi:hypothetical protein MON38_09725 [Hymenobacter sp. DH14]|uniref:Uncharacterized protein n=1 Tax=Hymenobacter cyanobacteriorum TaxID=2926463 RepID=A0A9X1VIN9_9BACT|nr:hypothetical protein [Hymenobacter cyanobacteriorum]MCI1187700.1 hypothetical protein [Hymenobacter cyanobacteriorum]
MARIELEMQFYAGKWEGNKWPSIDIEPVASEVFLPLLLFISGAYGFTPPPVTDIVEGYTAEFVIREKRVVMLLDNWTFSIASESEALRNDLLNRLLTLPPTFFDSKKAKGPE